MTAGDAGQASGPLHGTVVLDLGQVYNGPYCGWLLARLGARVIKVEPPGGDIVRARTRDPRGPYSYLMLNADKESVVLDLKSAGGRDLLLALVERADVLIENFSVGTMERLGLDWDTLRGRNSRLVYGCGTAFGPSGPLAARSAMDLTVQAMSGMIDATGFPDGRPVKSAAAVADFLGAVHLCVGVLAALLERERTGRGQWVSSSMHAAAVVALCSTLGAVIDRGPDAPRRTGNRHPALSVAPYNVYRAADGFLAINCPSQRHWVALTGVMGRPELATDPRFCGPLERTDSMDEVDRIVEEWTGSRNRRELADELDAVGVPCAPVLTVPEVLRDERLWAGGAFVEVADPVRGPLPLPASPVRVHGTTAARRPRPAPGLGEHTESVLAELLALGPERVERLRGQGAFGRG